MRGESSAGRHSEVSNTATDGQAGIRAESEARGSYSAAIGGCDCLASEYDGREHSAASSKLSCASAMQLSLDEMYDQHPFFICTDEDRQFIRSEIGLKESTIREGVDALMDWFQKQPHLVEAGIDRVTVENMLVLAKGSLEKTKKRIDSFYKYRSFAPELIQGRDKILSDPEDLWSSYVQISMPKLFKGNRVSVLSLTEKDATKFSGETLFRNTFMLGDIRLKYDYFLSDIWVLDMKNGSFSHLLKMNPVIMQKTSQIFHEGMGTRVQAIHILSANALLQQVVNFMKQFFSPKIMERIIIHDSVEDLHKYLPKQYLPKDYGGDEPYLMEFKDKYEKEMRSTRTKKYLIEASKMISNESRRPNAEKNEEFLVGSFRKLDLD